VVAVSAVARVLPVVASMSAAVQEQPPVVVAHQTEPEEQPVPVVVAWDSRKRVAAALLLEDSRRSVAVVDSHTLVVLLARRNLAAKLHERIVVEHPAPSCCQTAPKERHPVSALALDPSQEQALEHPT
jgi:hypothetical protein